MGQFTVPNAEQQELARLVGIDPNQYVVILDNDRCLWMLHLKTRHEVSITKNRGILRDRK